MTPIPYDCINDSKLHEGMRLAELSTSRRPSSISFECHSAQIFEEISAELDKLDLDDEDDDDTYGETNGTDDGSDNYEGPNGTTSLETILKDKTICPTHKYEARVVNNAMRRGNSMLLRRCSSDIMSGMRRTPSFIDRVISSVSAELRASGRFRDGVVTPVIVESKNETFSDTADGGNGPNNNGEQQNASASRAGRSLLGSKRPRRELCTNSDRSIVGRGTNQPNSGLEPNSFGSLRGADFLELMNIKSRS